MSIRDVRVRGTFALALVTGALLVSLTGCAGAPGRDAAAATSGGGLASPTSTHSTASAVAPTPTSVATTSTSTPGTTNGFVLEDLYRACIDRVPDGTWGGTKWTPLPLEPHDVGLAKDNVYTRDSASADSSAIWIGVDFSSADGQASIALCVASGDPSSPQVTFVRTID